MITTTEQIVPLSETSSETSSETPPADIGAHVSEPARTEPFPSVAPASSVPPFTSHNSRLTNCAALLERLAQLLPRFVVLPKFASETLALWIIHTWCFQFRDVSTYIGLESPEKRCGKTTLLGILSKLVNRPVIASNISPSAFFRVIEEMQPTLLIDEADTFLQGNDEIRGILNAGYHRDTAYVIRVSHEPKPKDHDPRSDAESQSSKFGVQGSKLSVPSLSSIPNPPPSPSSNARSSHLSPLTSAGLRHFTTWCPKIIAAIGHLPETLADRSVVIRMQRKRQAEECERIRNIDFASFRQRCAQFAAENEPAIRAARPQIPEALHDRAADIWEPLFAIADLAGGDWPEKARAAAVGLTMGAGDSNTSAALLFDIGLVFLMNKATRIFSWQLVQELNSPRFSTRPWMEDRRGKPVTEIWLSQQLRPYGVKSRALRINDRVGKGYELSDLNETLTRYVPQSELDNFKAELYAGEKPS